MAAFQVFALLSANDLAKLPATELLLQNAIMNGEFMAVAWHQDQGNKICFA